MKLADTSTPVVVLNCGLGALSIMRTLGYLGVSVYGVTSDPRAHALRSRYCRQRFVLPDERASGAALARSLLDLRRNFEKKPILIATSDETAIVVADAYDELAEAYLIAQNGGSIVAALADKMTMFGLARKHGLPAPQTLLPRTLEEAKAYAATASYPVMLKGAMGNRLYARTGKKMVFVHSAAELLEQYQLLQDPDQPNLMIQEVIPGGDDEVYIFNGYFDRNSDCLVGYTGRKIRQFPVHVGCASLGECCWVQEVADLTTTFMKKVGYRGILDIGYRKDPRDGRYKVLDINPRVGQAFRLFVSDNDLDVVRALYLDQTGQPVPVDSARREGRRWIIEDYDLISSLDYFREGSLSFSNWARSFKRLEEGAWFSLKDPLPLIDMLGRLAVQAFRWIRKRVIRPAA
jgi:predicted ATP-grasp superfamily ATP-dependent carboligase